MSFAKSFADVFAVDDRAARRCLLDSIHPAQLHPIEFPQFMHL